MPAPTGREECGVSLFDEAYWEERYQTAAAVWSGEPNRQLVAETAELPPGTALDAGSGEGADAIWLAGRGWRVTAVDFATTALERGAQAATAAGVADRIGWVHADLRSWTPPEQYDLVSAQFFHLSPPERGVVFAALAAAVAPGGRLLLVGHDVSDLESEAHRPHAPERFFTAAEVATSLDPAEWEVVTAATRRRPALDHEAEHHGVTVADTVLVARRLS
jgi:cyclopropane fatty-acyl-phospholipid synthase-like methyltransferase